MALMDDPEQSRRLATALFRAELPPEQYAKALAASKRARTWNDLPQWLRHLVAATEREFNGPA